MKKDSIILIAFIAIFLFSLQLYSLENVPIIKAQLHESMSDFNLAEIQQMVTVQGKQYFLESANHRIAIAEHNKITGQIGRIGQKNGELYYPLNLVVKNEKDFFVLDFIGEGTNRIQHLDQNGNYISGFTIFPKVWVFSINEKKEVFLGQPHLGNLFSVYNIKGKRLKRFGEPILPSSILGPAHKNLDKNHKIPMNRVNITHDNKDNLWASFLFMPLIVKYSPDGELVFKKVITTPGLTPVVKALLNPGSKDARNYLSRNIDGIQMPVIIKEIVFNKYDKNIYALLGSNEILKLNPDGETVLIIKPQFKKGALEKIFIDNQNHILVKFFFHSQLYRLEINEAVNLREEE